MFKFDQTLKTLVTANIHNGHVPMLIGEPGIGKSSWVESLASDLHTKCFVLAVNQLADKADLLGPRMVKLNQKDENGEEQYMQKFFPHSVISQAVSYAKEHPHETPILFLDEINRCGSDITSAALSLPTLRSIGDTRLPDNLSIMVAGNDKGNVTPLDQASISRFIKYPVEPDLMTFLTVNPNLNVHIKEVLKKKPGLLFAKKCVGGSKDEMDDDNLLDFLEDEDSMEQITTPRTISALSDTLNQLSNDELKTLLTTVNKDTSSLADMIEAHTGKTAFSDELIRQIEENLNTVNNQANAFVMEMPPRYQEITGQLRQCSTLAEMETKARTLCSDSEISAIITYALYENADNDTLLDCLGTMIDEFKKDDFGILMKASFSNGLNKANVEHFMKLSNSLTKQIGYVLTYGA